MKRVSFVLIYCYIHIYTHDRIKVIRSIRRNKNNKAVSIKTVDNKLKSTGNKVNSLPPILTWGREFSSKQIALNNLHIDDEPQEIRAWHCLILERKVKHEWIVKVSDDAVLRPFFGWLCNCGCWTCGDDIYHTPVFCRVGSTGRGKWLCQL